MSNNTSKPEQSAIVTQGASTLLEALAHAAHDGFTANFISQAESKIRCRACNHTFATGAVQIDGYERLEGASNPADMLLVVRAGCPSCSERGVMTLGYGPSATKTDADVLARLDLSAAEGATR